MLGRSERGADAIAETMKIHRRENPKLDRRRQGEYYFGVGGKNFLGGAKNNQLLNTTMSQRIVNKPQNRTHTVRGR